VEEQNGFYLQLDLSLRRSDWHWARTIEIVESIIARVNGFLRSWNFNRYKERVGPLKVALRLNIQEADRQKIEQILEGVRDDGAIVNFVSCDQPWREPDFVILAHELATESALKFKHQSDQSDDIRRIMDLQEAEVHQIVSFFYCLLRSIVNHLNFTIPRLWEYERHNPLELQRVEHVADNCIPKGAEDQLELIEPSERGSFLERYIHCFFNCIGMQNIMIDNQEISLELIVKRWLLDSVLWEQISTNK